MKLLINVVVQIRLSGHMAGSGNFTRIVKDIPEGDDELIARIVSQEIDYGKRMWEEHVKGTKEIPEGCLVDLASTSILKLE